MIYPTLDKRPSEIIIFGEEDLTPAKCVEIAKEYDTWWDYTLKALWAWR